MSAIRLTGSTSGYAEITPSAIAGDVQLVLPSTAGTLDRLNRAGNILQVVGSSYSTSTSRSVNSFADTGLTATITPTSSSSKVLVLLSQNGCAKTTNNTSIGLRLLANGVQLIGLEGLAGSTGTSTNNYFGSISTVYLHSPNTTSAVTYKTTFASQGNSASVFVQADSGGGDLATSTITLLEIAA